MSPIQLLTIVSLYIAINVVHAQYNPLELRKVKKSNHGRTCFFYEISDKVADCPDEPPTTTAIPDCTPYDSTYIDDPDICPTITFRCSDDEVRWDDPDCGCGCKPCPTKMDTTNSPINYRSSSKKSSSWESSSSSSSSSSSESSSGSSSQRGTRNKNYKKHNSNRRRILLSHNSDSSNTEYKYKWDQDRGDNIIGKRWKTQYIPEHCYYGIIYVCPDTDSIDAKSFVSEFVRLPDDKTCFEYQIVDSKDGEYGAGIRLLKEEECDVDYRDLYDQIEDDSTLVISVVDIDDTVTNAEYCVTTDGIEMCYDGFTMPDICGENEPTQWPTEKPTNKPSEWPTVKPTQWWTTTETPDGIIDSTMETTTSTAMPSYEPTEDPTPNPTGRPTTAMPTSAMPTSGPTPKPTETPTDEPTDPPTFLPTEEPSDLPTFIPTEEPTSKRPTRAPTQRPVLPTPSPTNYFTTTQYITTTADDINCTSFGEGCSGVSPIDIQGICCRNIISERCEECMCQGNNSTDRDTQCDCYTSNNCPANCDPNLCIGIGSVRIGGGGGLEIEPNNNIEEKETVKKENKSGSSSSGGAWIAGILSIVAICCVLNIGFYFGWQYYMKNGGKLPKRFNGQSVSVDDDQNNDNQNNDNQPMHTDGNRSDMDDDDDNDDEESEPLNNQNDSDIDNDDEKDIDPINNTPGNNDDPLKLQSHKKHARGMDHSNADSRVFDQSLSDKQILNKI